MSDNQALIDMLLSGQTPGAFGTGSPAEAAQQPSGMANLFQGAYGALGGLAQRAFGASEEMRGGGAYNPAPAVEAAMLPMGTGAVAGVPVRGAEAVLGAGPIRAYHGSPHDFDRFDLSKIGTGEGAQAYGHGLYFAENEGVAKSYRDTLARQQNLAGAQAGIDKDALKYVDAHGSVDAARAAIEAEMAGYKPGTTSHNYLQSLSESLKPSNPGKMYEVNINADPNHFLDWDKPLSPEMAAKVKAAAENISPNLYERIMGTGRDLNKYGLTENIEGKTGESAIGQLKRGLGSDAAASQALREAGIPGIKYLDQGSRGVPTVSGRVAARGDGKFDIVDDFGVQAGPFPTLEEAKQYLDPGKNLTSNYVVFNDQIIDILKKYGLAGAAAPLAANPFQQPQGPAAQGFL